MTVWRGWLDRALPVGPRSVLFGGHQFILHPIMVAIGWRRCYGRLPRDPRIWAAFFLHDLGYLTQWCRNMDGDEGQSHPLGGANIMGRLFDLPGEPCWSGRWWRFTAGHSRYFCRLFGLEESPLMRADKLATVLTPYWLYITLVWLSGEYWEYIDFHRAAGHDFPPTIHGWARSLRDDWRRYGAAE